MTNPFYTHATFPAPRAPGSASALRAEFELVEAGFEKLPIAAAALAFVRWNAAGTRLENVTAITGLTFDGVIGSVTPAAGTFTSVTTGTLTATGAVALQGTTTVTGSLLVPTRAYGSTGQYAVNMDTLNAAILNPQLPGQTGNNGKFLKTSGTAASWEYVLQDYIASGGVTQGAVVQLKTNGQVEQVIGTTPAVASGVVFKAANTSTGAVAVSSGGTVVIAFSDSTNSGRPSVAVGAISGSTITFGAAVQINTDVAVAATLSVAFIDATKFCVMYGIAASFESKAVIGTVSGTTASFGTAQQVFLSGGGTTNPIGVVVWNTAASALAFVASVEITASAFAAQGKAATVSGTVLTFGAAVTLSVGSESISASPQAAYHAGESCVVAIFFGSTGSAVRCKAFTISGTTITAGVANISIYSGSLGTNLALAYDSALQRLMAVCCTTGPNDMRAVYFSVSGTVVTVVATSATLGAFTLFGIHYHSSYGTFQIRYISAGSAVLLGVRLSGTTFLFDTTFSYATTAALTHAGGAYSPVANKLISSNVLPTVANALVVQPLETNMEYSSAKILGIAKSTVLTGVAVEVAGLGAVEGSQTGLTVNSDYYVTYNGTLTTTSTNNILLGRAVGTTKLLVTKGS